MIRLSVGLMLLCMSTAADIAPARPVTIDIVPALAKAIAHREGFYKPGTLPQTHNNPGSLVFRHQRGALPGSTGRGPIPFARFRTADDGWRALERDLRLKLARRQALSDGWEYLK